MRARVPRLLHLRARSATVEADLFQDLGCEHRKYVCEPQLATHVHPKTARRLQWSELIIGTTLDFAPVIIVGVYIGKSSYIRQGEQSLDTFYSPWHLVEYYRYIRFFPDGSCLSSACGTSLCMFVFVV